MNMAMYLAVELFPPFLNLEVIALSLTAEAFGYDSENSLFKRLAESPEHIPNLISRRQFNVRRKLTACLAEDIRRDIAKSIDGGENVFVIDSKPVKVCQLARAKRCVMGNDNPQKRTFQRLLRLPTNVLLWV